MGLIIVPEQSHIKSADELPDDLANFTSVYQLLFEKKNIFDEIVQMQFSTRRAFANLKYGRMTNDEKVKYIDPGIFLQVIKVKYLILRKIQDILMPLPSIKREELMSFLPQKTFSTRKV